MAYPIANAIFSTRYIISNYVQREFFKIVCQVDPEYESGPEQVVELAKILFENVSVILCFFLV